MRVLSLPRTHDGGHVSKDDTSAGGLGSTIRQVRKRLGLTLQQVAEEANEAGTSTTKFSKSVLSKMERGVQSIDIDQLQAIALALDVPIVQLLDPDAPPPEPPAPDVSGPPLEIDDDRPYGPRGQRLWSAHCDDMLGQRGLVLLDEACRIADRLDKLDRIIDGREAWMEIAQEVATGETVTVIVRATPALVEARQQASALRQLIVQLPMREAGRGDGDDDSWLSDSSVGDTP